MLYREFGWSRKIMFSRNEELYVKARSTFDLIFCRWLKQNPTATTNCTGALARATLEVPISYLGTMEILLREVEEMNVELAATGFRIGIKPGRLNSRLVHGDGDGG